MMKEFLDQRLGIKQFSKTFAVILLILFLILWLIDSCVMPPYVHSIGTIKVPNITGLSLKKADDIVKNSKLRVADVREVYNETVPKGYIISQLPFAGSEVREGRRLYITVSRGIEKITVPYVIGKLERVAWIDIMRLGFNIGNIEYVERDDKPDGVVLAQYPHYGVNLPYGATINLIVSQAPPEAEISLFEGDITLQEARNLASQNSLILIVINPELIETLDNPVIRPDYNRTSYKLSKGDTVWVEIVPIY
ncbi:MAG: PASTA domain-containing protein [Ignavibacteria bacterium]|jgi:beta-lactam-binding protein with PASTA domain